MSHVGKGNVAGDVLTWDGTKWVWQQPATALADVLTISLASASRLVDIDTNTAPDQALVSVKSVEDFFQLDKSPLAATLAAADGITIVVSGTNPAHVWIRKLIRSLNWEHQTTWFIDPATGNDENPGDVVGAPLDTWTELVRRLNGGGVGDGVGNITATTTVTVAGGSLGNLTLDLRINDETVFFIIQGEISSTAPSAIDSVTNTSPVADTRGIINDAATVFVDKTRLRLTSGAQATAIAWVTRVIAAGSANVTRWARVDPTVSSNPTIVNAAAGDNFVVDTYATIFNRVNLRCRGQGRIIVRDCLITSGSGSYHRAVQDQDARAGVYFYACLFQRSSFIDSDCCFVSCSMLVVFVERSSLLFRHIVMPETTAASVTVINDMGNIAFSSGCCFDGTGLLLRYGGYANFPGDDCSWVDGLGNAAFDLNTGSSVIMEETTTQIWGANNAYVTAAIIVRGGSMFVYTSTLPHIPGGAVDCQIGGNNRAYASLGFFDAAHGCGVVDRPL